MTIDLKQIRAEALIAAEEAEHNERKYHSCQAHSGTIRMPARVVVEMCDRLIEAENDDSEVTLFESKEEALAWFGEDNEIAKHLLERCSWPSIVDDSGPQVPQPVIKPSTCGGAVKLSDLDWLAANLGKELWRAPGSCSVDSIVDRLESGIPLRDIWPVGMDPCVLSSEDAERIHRALGPAYANTPKYTAITVAAFSIQEDPCPNK